VFGFGITLFLVSTAPNLETIRIRIANAATSRVSSRQLATAVRWQWQLGQQARPLPRPLAGVLPPPFPPHSAVMSLHSLVHT